MISKIYKINIFASHILEKSSEIGLITKYEIPIPIIKIEAEIMKYAVRKKHKIIDTCAQSELAIGLYNLYTIPVPNPSSIIESAETTFRNMPSIPIIFKPKTFTKIFRVINEPINIMRYDKKLTKIFLIEFLVLILV